MAVQWACIGLVDTLKLGDYASQQGGPHGERVPAICARVP